MRRRVTPQDQSTIKYNNTKMVLDIIRNGSEVSRSAIARITGMSPTSATRIVGDLEARLLVRDTMPISNGVGRKAVMLDISESAFFYIGLDISETNLKLCLLNFGGKVVAKAFEPVPADVAGVDCVVDAFFRMYHALLQETGITEAQVAAAGVGAVGTVDSASGTVIYADLLRWSNIPIGKLLSERFNLPVYVDNDVKCAIIGETSTPIMKQVEDVVLLSFGQGVGGAIINRGRMVRGVLNSAGEIGHTIVDHTDGRLCFCGRRGCAAAYLTEQRILEEAQKSHPKIDSLSSVMLAFQAREPWSMLLMDRICNYISIVISNVVCFLNPRNIILSGKLMNEYPFLFDMSIEKYDAMIYSPLRATTVFTRSSLQQDATCIGSAMIALEKHTEHLLKEITLSPQL